MSGNLFGDDEDFLDPTEPKKGDVTLTLCVHGDAGMCVKVSEAGEEHGAVLLPRSQITMRDSEQGRGAVGRTKFKVAEITMPEWLAKDRKLI